VDDSDASLVEAARGGSDEAFARLVDRYLERCWNVAWRILHDRDRAADVAQEAMATAWQQLDTLASPGSFGGWVLRISRNRALNRLEHERRAVPVDEDRHLEPTDRLVVAVGPDERVERDEAADLVWGAAAALGERDASVLDLHLRHGLEPAELAEELGVTPNNAHQVLFRLRNRLGGAIRAYVLWHHGDPRCDELARLLEREGAATFGPATVRLIDRHATDCATCEDDREAVLAPAALFGAVPLAALPGGLRDRMLSALGEAGVPTPDLAGSDATDGSGPTEGPAGGDGAAGAEGAGAPGGVGGLDAPDASAPAVGGPVGPAVATLASGVVPAPEVRSERRGLVLASAGAAALLVAIVGLLLWGPGDVDEPVEVAGARSITTSTTAPEPAPTTARRGPTTTPATTTPDEVVAPTTAPPPAGPVTTTTVAPAPPPPPPPPPGPSTTTTAPPAPAPAVRLDESTFGIVATPECSIGHTVRWTTTDATSATFALDDGAPEPVPTAGERVVCARVGVVTLEATGPGGTTVATRQLVPG
jgi:RNA polymerase sigma factor (sigma-70 family)